MTETELQEKLSDNFRRFVSDLATDIGFSDAVDRWESRLPEVLRSVKEKVRTEAGREVEMTDVRVEVRKCSPETYFVEVRLGTETRMWMESF